MDEWNLSLRILVAAALSAVLGLEREWRGQSAGFRTHILVGVGSCLFTLVGTYAFVPDPTTLTQGLSVDPTRVASQIVVGIGFLGGGAILKFGGTVRGLTTAANLWLAAAIGMAVGVGYYFAAALCAVLSVVALAGLRPIERKLFPFDERRVRRSPPPENNGQSHESDMPNPH